MIRTVKPPEWQIATWPLGQLSIKLARSWANQCSPRTLRLPPRWRWSAWARVLPKPVRAKQPFTPIGWRIARPPGLLLGSVLRAKKSNHAEGLASARPFFFCPQIESTLKIEIDKASDFTGREHQRVGSSIWDEQLLRTQKAGSSISTDPPNRAVI